MSKSRTEVNSYFHGSVDIGSGNSADYVVAHAARQHQRRRNPSVPYKGIVNPPAALEAAQADINERAVDPDERVNYTAAFSGRVALMHIWDKYQVNAATGYANARMEHDGAVGAVLQIISAGQELPKWPHPTEGGTVEFVYHDAH